MRYVVAFMLLAVVGCHPREAERTPPPAIEHVVLIWLKNPADAAGRQRVIDAADSFRTISGIQRITIGRALPSTRAIVDSSFHVGIVFTFRSEADLEAYLTHAAHSDAVEKVLKPLSERIVVYDVVAE